jgi:hypothetical protein
MQKKITEIINENKKDFIQVKIEDITNKNEGLHSPKESYFNLKYGDDHTRDDGYLITF